LSPKVYHLRRSFVAVMVFVILAVPFSGITPVAAQRKALILSSLEQYTPMGYVGSIQRFLTSAGYEVTFVGGRNVTVSLLTTQLNNYDVIIWRTNAYEWAHVLYWYVGEIASQASLGTYAADFAAGWLDAHNGILGVSLDFFLNHFQAGSLSNVKVAILVASLASPIANALVSAGVRAVIDTFGIFSLYFNTLDYVIGTVVLYLSNGYNVKDAVYSTITPYVNMVPRDPLDSVETPQIWFTGDGTATIT